MDNNNNTNMSSNNALEKKPIKFQLEQDGDFYMIGSQVFNTFSNTRLTRWDRLKLQWKIVLLVEAKLLMLATEMDRVLDPST